MNSRQYEKMMKEALAESLAEFGITDYKSVVLSADRTEYEVELADGSIKVIPSGFDYCPD